MAAVPVVAAGTVMMTSTLEAAAADESGQEIINATDEQSDPPERPRGKVSSITVSIETVIMSALIFVAILAWFEFLRAWYDNTFDNRPVHDYDIVYHRFWYAIFITALAIVLLYILLRVAGQE